METEESYLITTLKEREERHILHMIGGGCKDFAEYRELVGKINEIEFVIEELKDVIKKFEVDSGKGYEDLGLEKKH